MINPMSTKVHISQEVKAKNKSPWWQIVTRSRTRSDVRLVGKGSRPSHRKMNMLVLLVRCPRGRGASPVSLNSRSTNFAINKSAMTIASAQDLCMLTATKTNLRIPIRNMFISFISLLPQSPNDIPKRTQTLINTLRLPQPLLIPANPTLFQPLTPSQIHQIQAPLTPLSSHPVPPTYPQYKHRMGAGRTFVHQCRGDAAPGLGEGEEGTDLNWGG